MSSTSDRKERRTLSAGRWPRRGEGVARVISPGAPLMWSKQPLRHYFCDAPVDPALVQSTRAFGVHEAMLRANRSPHPGAQSVCAKHPLCHYFLRYTPRTRPSCKAPGRSGRTKLFCLEVRNPLHRRCAATKSGRQECLNVVVPVMEYVDLACTAALNHV